MEKKETSREGATQIPPGFPQIPLSRYSATCPTSDARHKPQGNRLAPQPSQLHHKDGHTTTSDPGDWDSQDLSREEDDTLEHRLPAYPERSGGAERRE